MTDFVVGCEASSLLSMQYRDVVVIASAFETKGLEYETP